jgi:hypothetical protein
MNRISALRALLGVVAAVVIAIPAPAFASGGASTHQARQASSEAVHVAAGCTAGAHACPIRITFAAGAYSGQAHSQLTGIHSEKWFAVHARADQTMIVVVEGKGATRGIVYFPNGHSSGQPGGRVFDDVLPVSGDYKIKVTESQMGEAWSGRVDVVVLIY